MADDNLVLEATRLRKVGDALDRPQAELAPVVEVDVDAAIEALGEAEDDVQVALRIAVDAGGVEAADEIRTLAEGFGEQVGNGQLLLTLTPDEDKG